MQDCCCLTASCMHGPDTRLSCCSVGMALLFVSASWGTPPVCSPCVQLTMMQAWDPEARLPCAVATQSRDLSTVSVSVGAGSMTVWQKPPATASFFMPSASQHKSGWLLGMPTGRLTKLSIKTPLAGLLCGVFCKLGRPAGGMHRPVCRW